MFLRRNRKRHQGANYDYWTLVESVRTARGPRQRTVATLGKLPGLDEETRVGWEHIGDILDGRARTRDFLNAPPDPPEWSAMACILSLARFARPLRNFRSPISGTAIRRWTTC
ncbi:hypothetical protein HQ520_10685 [bacterium]|nr:hypothetical protein [bacterium]